MKRAIPPQMGAAMIMMKVLLAGTEVVPVISIGRGVAGISEVGGAHDTERELGYTGRAPL